MPTFDHCQYVACALQTMPAGQVCIAKVLIDSLDLQMMPI